MAGYGKRFLNENIVTPKPIIEINGKLMIEHSIQSLGIEGRYIFITKKYSNKEYNKILTEAFKRNVEDFVEICLEEEQFGTSYSALSAKHLIDNEEELILTNCDQILNWNSDMFLKFSRSGLDGSVLIHESRDPKHSYAVVNNGLVSVLEEKKVISNDALVGLHYWKHGKDFVSSAEKLILDNPGSKESYVSQTFNYLINDGKKIGAYPIDNGSYISLGTPKDLEIYNNKVSEYYDIQPKTIFLDIDGTILKHSYHKDLSQANHPEALEGAVEKINSWRSEGNLVVITTARREHGRTQIEMELELAGIKYDQLIMGLTKGKRFLVNDKLNVNDEDRAVGINIITDSKFSSVSWGEYGL
jgi:NDP-sugar pyrophosphorylase family protein